MALHASYSLCYQTSNGNGVHSCEVHIMQGPSCEGFLQPEDLLHSLSTGHPMAMVCIPVRCTSCKGPPVRGSCCLWIDGNISIHPPCRMVR